MKWRVLGVITVIAFVVGLALMAPARMLEPTINRIAAPHAILAVSDGSIWSGLGKLTLSAFNNHEVPIRWQFRPRALLRLELGFVVTVEGPTLAGKANIGAGFGEISISETKLVADAAPLLAKHRGLTAMVPRGKVNVSASGSDELRIAMATPHAVNGSFNSRVEDFSLRTLLARPLSSADIRFVVRNSVGEYQVTQSSGALKVLGNGVVPFGAHGEFRYAGTLTPDRELPATLAYLVRALGVATADGGVRVDYRTSW